MDDLAKQVNELTTQIILINRDIKQLADNYTSLNSKLEDTKSHERTMLTLQSLIESQERRILILEREYADFRTFTLNVQNDFSKRVQDTKDAAREQDAASAKEILETLKAMDEKMTEKFVAEEERIRALENWRWYVLGIMFAIAFFLSGVPWKVIFTN